RLFLVEVMGRNAGDIALNAGIGAGAEEILIPEENLGTKRLLKSLERSRKSGKTSSIIVVSEGEKTGKNIMELADYIQSRLKNYEVRVSVVGHIQRGGATSCYDRVLASRMGIAAVEILSERKNTGMVGIKNNILTTVPFEIALSGKSELDTDLLRVNDITSI